VEVWLWFQRSLGPASFRGRILIQPLQMYPALFTTLFLVLSVFILYTDAFFFPKKIDYNGANKRSFYDFRLHLQTL
jgi:hypothetical protein